MIISYTISKYFTNKYDLNHLDSHDKGFFVGNIIKYYLQRVPVIGYFDIFVTLLAYLILIIILILDGIFLAIFGVFILLFKIRTWFIRFSIKNKFDNEQYLVLFSENHKLFYNDILSSKINNSIKIIDASNHNVLLKSDLDLLKLINSHIKKPTHPIYLSFKNRKYCYQNLKNSLTRYNHSKISKEELINIINSYEYKGIYL